MSPPRPLPAPPSPIAVLPRVTAVTLIWIGASLGFYRLQTALGTSDGYNDAPLVFAAYYGVLALASALVLSPSHLVRARLPLPPSDLVPKILLALGCLGFALVGLRLLPAISWPEKTEPLPGLLSATALYFLPKSVEILFQQVLITTLVLVFHQAGMRILPLSLLMAALFGGFHLSLAFEGKDLFYVARYALAATAFGAAVPYLMLHLRSGFVIAYALHWGFYAADLTVAHFVAGSAPAL